MIFPIQQKNMYLSPWDVQFQHFKKSLQDSTEWIVIGYAFNDEFILNVFKEALKDDKKLVIIDPNAIEIKDKKFGKDNSVISLPIKFGTKYFELQLQDYQRGIKSINVLLGSKPGRIDLQLEPGMTCEKIDVDSNKLPNIVQYSQKILEESVVPKKYDTYTLWRIGVPYNISKDIKFSFTTSFHPNMSYVVYYHDKVISSRVYRTKADYYTNQYYTNQYYTGITISAKSLL